MDTDSNGNEHNGRRYIIFGDPGHEVELSDEHAARVLGLLWERHRAQLSGLIGEAHTGTKPSGRK